MNKFEGVVYYIFSNLGEDGLRVFINHSDGPVVTLKSIDEWKKWWSDVEIHEDFTWMGSSSMGHAEDYTSDPDILALVDYLNQ